MNTCDHAQSICCVLTCLSEEAQSLKRIMCVIVQGPESIKLHIKAALQMQDHQDVPTKILHRNDKPGKSKLLVISTSPVLGKPPCLILDEGAIFIRSLSK